MGGDIQGERWDGQLSDVRLYSRALTDAEIKAIGGQPKARKPTPANGAAGVAMPLLQWTAGADAAFHAAESILGQVDIVINNAGILRDRSIKKMTLAEWREKSRNELAKRMRTRARDLPEEKWAATHGSGAAYTVTLVSGRDTVLTAEADLFTLKIKVDIHVQ